MGRTRPGAQEEGLQGPASRQETEVEEMTKRDADKLLYQCYGILRDPDAILMFKKLNHRVAGVAYPWANSMVVDPAKDALTTVLHECIHLLRPTDDERLILKLEKGLVNNMTHRQWKNLCLRIGGSFKEAK